MTDIPLTPEQVEMIANYLSFRADVDDMLRAEGAWPYGES